jgi:mRNA-degrading endonuclease HigB of HigAB toxin-antitoxin module
MIDILNKIETYLIEGKVADTILKQIKSLDKWALPSWGAKNFISLDKEKGVQFDVSGSKFKGRILIYYDRGSDTYTIEMGKVTKKLEWKQTNLIKQVFMSDLVNILDQHIG